MELNEKLQELRKRKGLTQEELAACLYVSRTAISKWESGRGYPSIDSLKAIAKFFDVTVDELLSGEELLTIAEADQKQKQTGFRDLVFGLLDCSVAVLLFFPFFGQKNHELIESVSLLHLTEIAHYLKLAYWITIVGITLTGLVTLALQNCRGGFWLRCKKMMSLVFNGAGVLLFIISTQPYAATFLFVHLIIKVLVLIKQP